MTADKTQSRENNFNILRLVAASCVLVSHAWPIALGKGAVEPLEASTGYTLGSIAVIVFFAVSGFFITKSFDQRRSLLDFVVARVARIYPGLLVVLLLTVLVLGPAFTMSSLKGYATSLATWTYVPRNALLTFQYDLPGVFLHSPYPRAINGSLWTLFYEVFCYAMVVGLGYLGLLRAKTLPLVLAALVAIVMLVPQQGFGLAAGASVLAFPFALGAAAYVYRTKLVFHSVGVLVLGAVALLFAETRLHQVTFPLALSYAALWFGFARMPWLAWYRGLGDPSYGMYIYAFPIEQIVVSFLPGLGPWGLIAVALPITLLCAIVSWRWIESPALARRHAILPMIERAIARLGGKARFRLVKSPKAR